MFLSKNQGWVGSCLRTIPDQPYPGSTSRITNNQNSLPLVYSFSPSSTPRWVLPGSLPHPPLSTPQHPGATYTLILIINPPELYFKQLLVSHNWSIAEGGQLSALLTSGNLFSLGSEWRSCDTRRDVNCAKQPWGSRDTTLAPT